MSRADSPIEEEVRRIKDLITGKFTPDVNALFLELLATVGNPDLDEDEEVRAIDALKLINQAHLEQNYPYHMLSVFVTAGILKEDEPVVERWRDELVNEKDGYLTTWLSSLKDSLTFYTPRDNVTIQGMLRKLLDHLLTRSANDPNDAHQLAKELFDKVMNTYTAKTPIGEIIGIVDGILRDKATRSQKERFRSLLQLDELQTMAPTALLLHSTASRDEFPANMLSQLTPFLSHLLAGAASTVFDRLSARFSEEHQRRALDDMRATFTSKEYKGIVTKHLVASIVAESNDSVSNNLTDVSFMNMLYLLGTLDAWLSTEEQTQQTKELAAAIHQLSKSVIAKSAPVSQRGGGGDTPHSLHDLKLIGSIYSHTSHPIAALHSSAQSRHSLHTQTNQTQPINSSAAPSNENGQSNSIVGDKAVAQKQDSQIKLTLPECLEHLALAKGVCLERVHNASQLAAYLKPVDGSKESITDDDALVSLTRLKTIYANFLDHVKVVIERCVPPMSGLSKALPFAGKKTGDMNAYITQCLEEAKVRFTFRTDIHSATSRQMAIMGGINKAIKPLAIKYGLTSDPFTGSFGVRGNAMSELDLHIVESMNGFFESGKVDSSIDKQARALVESFEKGSVPTEWATSRQNNSLTHASSTSSTSSRSGREYNAMSLKSFQSNSAMTTRESVRGVADAYSDHLPSTAVDASTAAAAATVTNGKHDCDCNNNSLMNMQPKFDKEILQKTYRQVALFKDLLVSYIDRRITPSIEALEEQLERRLGTTPEPVQNENGKIVKSYAAEAVVITSYRSVLKFYKRTANDVFQLHFDFLTKEIKSGLRYIRMWQTLPEYVKIEKDLEEQKRIDMQASMSGGSGLAPEDVRKRAVTQTFKDFFALLEEVRVYGRTHLDKLIEQLDSSLLKTKKESLDTEEDKLMLDEDRDKTYSYLTNIGHKLSAIYSNEISIMDIILDSEFLVLYVLKIVHYSLMLLSFYLAEKIFNEMYMKAVYGKGGDPPDILTYVGIFLGLDLAMMLFMMAVLVMVMYLFKSPGNTFIINGRLLKSFMVDYVISIVLIMLIGIIVGMTIQKKRYFRYKTEGLRGIRALKEMMMSISAIIIVMPFFMVL